MREVVIVDGARSAFTNFGGGLRTLASVDIASKVVDGLLDRFAENVGHALDNDRILLSKEA